jgi:hypothetical protein
VLCVLPAAPEPFPPAPAAPALPLEVDEAPAGPEFDPVPPLPAVIVLAPVVIAPVPGIAVSLPQAMTEEKRTILPNPLSICRTSV